MLLAANEIHWGFTIIFQFFQVQFNRFFDQTHRHLSFIGLVMVIMGKAKKDTLEKVLINNTICSLCRKVVRNGGSLCVHCKNRVIKKHDPEAHNFDKYLFS